MIAGIVLADRKGQDSCLAFLGEETETVPAETNEEIIEELEQRQPEIIAVDCGTDLSRKEFTEQEEELKEEGFNFTPSAFEDKKIKRLKSLKAAANHTLDQPPEFIRFDPQITAEELAIDGDQAMRGYGVSTESIESAREFDAMLGAVTARFYQQDQFRDLGVIVPSALREEKDEKT